LKLNEQKAKKKIFEVLNVKLVQLAINAHIIIINWFVTITDIVGMYIEYIQQYGVE